MNNVTICKRCGDISDEGINSITFIGGKGPHICRFCGSDVDVLDFTFSQAKQKYAQQIADEFGVIDTKSGPFDFYCNKIIRENYYKEHPENKVDTELIKTTEKNDFEQLYYFDKPDNTQPSKPEENVPKCPICGSTNLKKITGTRKAMKIGLFGLFGAGDLGKTYQCGQCGAKF